MKHIFDTDIAKQHGFAAAVIHENICHWVRVNKANGNNLHSGRFWTFNSVKAFGEIFDYLKPWQIRMALDDLVNAGLLLKGCFNKKGYDRTAWYTTADDSSLSDESHLRQATNGVEAEHKSNCGEPQVHLRDITNPFEAGSEPIPDIKPILKPDENTDSAPGLDRLSEHIEQYSKKVCRVDRIALDYKINQASAKVSIETLEQCLQGVLQAADDPTYPADKLPRSLSALLGDVERIDSWARRYTAKQPKSAQTWWSGMSEEAIIDRITSLLRYRIEVPQEVQKWIPQAQQRLNERLAV